MDDPLFHQGIECGWNRLSWRVRPGHVLQNKEQCEFFGETLLSKLITARDSLRMSILTFVWPTDQPPLQWIFCSRKVRWPVQRCNKRKRDTLPQHFEAKIFVFSIFRQTRICMVYDVYWSLHWWCNFPITDTDLHWFLIFSLQKVVGRGAGSWNGARGVLRIERQRFDRKENTKYKIYFFNKNHTKEINSSSCSFHYGRILGSRCTGLSR